MPIAARSSVPHSSLDVQTPSVVNVVPTSPSTFRERRRKLRAEVPKEEVARAQSLPHTSVLLVCLSDFLSSTPQFLIICHAAPVAFRSFTPWPDRPSQSFFASGAFTISKGSRLDSYCLHPFSAQRWQTAVRPVRPGIRLEQCSHMCCQKNARPWLQSQLAIAKTAQLWNVHLMGRISDPTPYDQSTTLHDIRVQHDDP